MAGAKVTNILRSQSNFTEEDIASMSDADGWKWIYANKKPNPNKGKEQICFSGFRPAEKDEIAKIAEEAGFKVVKSITKSLNFLCVGETPGPKKIEKAESQDVKILNAHQLILLLETGEIPE